MENNNFYPMMMGMNNQMMGGMNNLMMMGMNNQMMNICPMNNMNMAQNMGIMGMTMNNYNFPQNNLNDFDNARINNNPICKTVRLYFDGEFIQNVTLFNNANYYSISNTFKQILYAFGKKPYYEAGPYEIIERDSPDETLEFLINRGVVDNNPRIIISSLQHNYCRKPVYTFKDINNGDRLEVKYEGRTIGGGGLCNIEFVDVDKSTKTTKINIYKDATKWRQVSIGLNLFGKCINKECKAFNEEVIYRVGINQKFDLNSDDRKRIKCPICSKNFLPITMGFWKCEYQIKGEKFRNGNYEEVNINGKETKGDDFEYFNPYKIETASWSNLMIFTGHRQKMKYKEKGR